jgi:hypothetical protein
MDSNPTTDLIALAVRNIDEIKDPMRRAELLSSAADLIAEQQPMAAEAIRATVAIIREADRSQMKLIDLFSSKAN